MCVESWLKDTPGNTSKRQHESTFAPGFVQLQKIRDPSRNGGGILIMIRKSIAFQEIPINSPDYSVEICKFRLTNTTPSIDVIVCYRHPGSLSQDQWNSIVSSTNNNHPCLLIGDFNAHNIIWNCYETNTNGRHLANSMDDYNLFLHNFDTLTHIDPRNRKLSNIDLVFSTLNLSEKINTEVFDETLGSDYFPIFCSIDLEKNIYKKNPSKLKLNALTGIPLQRN